MAEEPRYAFHPLERRGLLLGLDAGQLVTVAGGVLAALMARAVVPAPSGTVLAIAVAGAAVGAGVWTREGRPLAVKAMVATAWLARGGSRTRFDAAPVVGSRPAGAVAGGRSVTRAGLQPAGIVLTGDAGGPAGGPLGIVRDRRPGTWGAVVPVEGCSFCLLDPGDQARRLEGWRRVLGSLARPGSPVVRLQWVQRSWTGEPASAGAIAGTGDEAVPGGGGPGPAAAVSSYHRLVDSVLPVVRYHRAWLVLVVRSGAGGGVGALRRELRLLEGQLRAAELRPLDPLGPDGLADLVGRRSRSPGSTGSGAWPLAASDGWSAYRADGFWHATYWVAEWPRLEVGPDFLTPLLLHSARTSVSVLMAPVAHDRAMREVRSARTADLADARLRARAGFLQSARRERESLGVARREEELADGHQEFRFTGYVTVSAADDDGLSAACAELEHAAQSSRLEIRRLYGRQAEAYTWTLPLGRGLR